MTKRGRGQLGWVIGLIAALAVPGAGAPVIERAAPMGRVALAIGPGAVAWSVSEVHTDGDLLFSDGVTLASMRSAAGDVNVTVSLDENNPMGLTRREAFLALAAEKEAAGGSMRVWPAGGREWIVQEFRSPSERVVAAQCFVGPYALGLLFWLDPEGEVEAGDRWVRGELERYTIEWDPRPPPPAADGGG